MTAHPIRTSNENSQTIRDNCANGESGQDWLTRHSKNIQAENEAGEFPLTNTLTSIWHVGEYQEWMEQTTRTSGQSDQGLREAHHSQCSSAMSNGHSPIP